jgi:predicted nucleic acid-binding protein
LKVLFDTSIVLDVLLDREPFSTAAALLFSKVERSELEGYLCTTTIATVHYLAGKALGANQAREHIGKLLTLFRVAPVNRLVLEAALKAGFAHFEDAVIHEAALHVGAQGLVTRNPSDFKGTKIPVYSSDELLRALMLHPPEAVPSKE